MVAELGQGELVSPPPDLDLCQIMGKLLLLIQGLLLVAEEPWYIGLSGEAGSVPRKPVPRYVGLREPLIMGTGPGSCLLGTL